jgi:hypothetical protein
LNVTALGSKPDQSAIPIRELGGKPDLAQCISDDAFAPIAAIRTNAVELTGRFLFRVGPPRSIRAA